MCMFFKVIKDVYNTVIPPWGEIFKEIIKSLKITIIIPIMSLCKHLTTTLFFYQCQMHI